MSKPLEELARSAGMSVDDFVRWVQREDHRRRAGVPEKAQGPAVTIRTQRVLCGSERCGRCSGPQASGHGPYTYAAWRSSSGRMRSLYVGQQSSRGRVLAHVQLLEEAHVTI